MRPADKRVTNAVRRGKKRRLTNPDRCFNRKVTDPGRFVLSGKASTRQPLSSEEGTTYKVLRNLTSKPMLKSGLDCLICAPFSIRSTAAPRRRVPRKAGISQPPYGELSTCAIRRSIGVHLSWPLEKKMKIHSLRLQHNLQLGHRGRRATVSAIGRFPQISDCSESWGQDRA